MLEMLSPHFSRAEFEHSDTATARGIRNVMGPVELSAAKALCFHVFEPIRAHFGRPVNLNSGFRSRAVNLAVGSKPGSQHERGEAGDHEIAGVPNAELALWIKGSNIDFDQLILEAYQPGVPGSGWVHVSRTMRGKQRRQCLTMTMGSHGPVYSLGINP